MVDEMNTTALHKQLFDSKNDVYAVADGALLPGLLAKLEEHEPKNTCLFRGELPFDLAEAAPYLVKLEKDNKFSDWLLNESLEEPCCIYAQTTVIDDFIQLRKHFRSFLRVKSPEGKNLLFRYYDPRVMKTYLPTCTPEDNKVIFNGIESYLIFNEEDKKFETYKEPNPEEFVSTPEPEEVIEDQSNIPDVGKTDVDEEKTVMMQVKAPVQKEGKLTPEKASPLPKSSETDVNEEKTVIMRIKPKQ